MREGMSSAICGISDHSTHGGREPTPLDCDEYIRPRPATNYYQGFLHRIQQDRDDFTPCSPGRTGV